MYRLMNKGLGLSLSFDAAADVNATMKVAQLLASSAGTMTPTQVYSLYSAYSLPAAALPPQYAYVVRCLYHTDGTPVRSYYARSAAIYGEGGAAGSSKVCYKALVNSSYPGRVPLGPSVFRCAKDIYGVNTVYDIYRNPVCFRPVDSLYATSPYSGRTVQTSYTITSSYSLPAVTTAQTSTNNGILDQSSSEPGGVLDTADQAETPTNIVTTPSEQYTPPPADYYMAPEPAKDNKKLMIIGGIIAVVAVGGLALAISKRK